MNTQLLRSSTAIATVLACLPYLSLKVAWILGIPIGIPEASALRDPSSQGLALGANVLTLLMDVILVALILLLTRPFGRRVGATPLLFVSWGAVGLLAPIALGFAAQQAARLLPGPGSDPPAPEFLDPWVPLMVYGGFTLQGLGLSTLFVLYAVDRWGGLLGKPLTTASAPPHRTPLRLVAVLASVSALITLSLQVMWSTGSTIGLTESMAAGQGVDQLLVHAIHAAFTISAMVGVLLLAFGTIRLPTWVPLVLAWVGSGAMAGWGAWSILSGLLLPSGAEPATPLMNLATTAQLLAGMMIAVAGMHWLAERWAISGPPTPRSSRSAADQMSPAK
ncbi:hypothetical protein GCM10022261_17070 [Brevibacterium daeguense]|uniref:Uncharacterized protein n=1 Tax=Brevibacterium daeguense TaxID=909936 RepID=A0ABP8EJU3_9MICO|nr:hypothetical protein [Brevibacterium daeguense]